MLRYRNNLPGGSPPSPATRAADALVLRAPRARDGAAVAALIRSCPPLDRNSLYCNLLQCTHFAATCVLALQGERAVGWISAYRPPDDAGALFVWQVAVAEALRGAGVGARMLDHLVARPACRGVTRLEASVTASNSASEAMFASFARRHGAGLERREWLDRDAHFGGGHPSEVLIRIAPLSSSSDWKAAS